MSKKDITEPFYSPPPLPEPKPIIIMSILDDGSDDPERRSDDPKRPSSTPSTPSTLGSALESASSGESGSSTEASVSASAATASVDILDSPEAASGAGPESAATLSGESESIALLHPTSNPTPPILELSDPLAGVRSKHMRAAINRDAFKTSDLATQDSVIASRAKQFEAGNSEQLSERMQALSSQLFSHTPTPNLNLDPAARAAMVEALKGDAPSWFKSAGPTSSKALEQPATKLATQATMHRDFGR